MTTLVSLFLSLFDESVPLGMSMRKQNHHHPENDCFLLVDLKRGVVGQDAYTEDVIDEALDNQVHLVLGEGLDATIFHILMPSCRLVHLQLAKSLFVECVELNFVELSHGSKARSFEEEVKVLIVFGFLGPPLFPLLLCFHLILYLVFIRFIISEFLCWHIHLKCLIRENEDRLLGLLSSLVTHLGDYVTVAPLISLVPW